MSATQEPNLVKGKASTSVDTFESWAQVTEAMKDPRYTKDPAYQAEIQSKLRNSNLQELICTVKNLKVKRL